jgi:hypothetical protein
MRLLWAHPLGRVVAKTGSDASASMLTMLDHAVKPKRSNILQAMGALARAVQRLGCEQILPIRGARKSANARLIVESDLPAGSPLSTLLGQDKLPLEAAVGVLRQVAHALAVAHQGGLMHGALSTASVIVSDDELRSTRVADFGLGQLDWSAVENDPEQIPVTPERVLGMTATPAEDVYLFGCVAYAVLGGRAPFVHGTAEELRRRHAIEDATDLTELGAGDVPEPIRNVVMRCLAKDAEDRYADAAELEIAWCEAQVEANVSTGWEHLPIPTRRRKRRPTLIQKLNLLARGREPGAPAKAEERVTARFVQRTQTEPRDVGLPDAPPVPPEPTSQATSLPAAPSEASTSSPALSASMASPDVAPPKRSRTGLMVVLGLVAAVGIAGTVVDWRAWIEGTVSTKTAGSATAEPGAADGDNEAEYAAERLEKAKAAAVDGADDTADPEGEDTADEAVADSEAGDGDDEGDGGDDDNPTFTISDLMKLGAKARAAGDKAGARRAYKKVIGRRPRHAAALTALGEISFSSGDVGDAAKWFARAVKVNGKSAALRIQLGDAYFKLGRYPQAKKEFAKAESLGHAAASRRLELVDKKLGG